MTVFGRILLFAAILALAPAAWTQSTRPVHVVVPGDTLYALAERYGTTVAELRRLNGLPGDLLRVGAELRLPYDAVEPEGYRPWVAGPDDTWEDVAAAVGRSVASLRAANPDIPADALPAGRLLLIPPGDGVTVRALPGESLADLALRYGLNPADVAAANGLEAEALLLGGEPVLVPFGATEAAVGPVLAVVDAKGAHREAQRALLARAPTLLATMAWPDTGFALPVQGRISSPFGWRNISVGGNRFHGGVDIAADLGTPVLTSRGGVVLRTGWIGAYGYAVYVDHGDGSQTRYAHLSRIDVVPGEALARGDRLGAVGSTGASTGPHLHFEIRIDGRAVDPLAYLESR